MRKIWQFAKFVVPLHPESMALDYNKLKCQAKMNSWTEKPDCFFVCKMQHFVFKITKK